MGPSELIALACGALAVAGPAVAQVREVEHRVPETQQATAAHCAGLESPGSELAELTRAFRSGNWTSFAPPEALTASRVDRELLARYLIRQHERPPRGCLPDTRLLALLSWTGTEVGVEYLIGRVSAGERGSVELVNTRDPRAISAILKGIETHVTEPLEDELRGRPVRTDLWSLRVLMSLLKRDAPETWHRQRELVLPELRRLRELPGVHPRIAEQIQQAERIVARGGSGGVHPYLCCDR